MNNASGNCPASVADGMGSNCTTRCSTSPESDFGAIIASRYPFVPTATVAALASMGWAARPLGGWPMVLTPQPSLKSSGGKA